MESTGEVAGSTATTLIWGFCSLRNSPTPVTANEWIWSAPADRMEAELDAGGIRVGAKYRYRQKDQAATLTRGADGQMLLTFDEPQRAIAPGQAVVVYRGDIVLGGGTVTGALK